jgi:CheY-like chemotaxis protein/tetratricopeptide (TPR) repeat protein
MLSKTLSAEGYRVLVAHDGDEALLILNEAEPDLVLLDLRLPRRDGIEVLETIRGLGGAAAATPAVLLADSAPSAESAQRARALGAAALVKKPIPLARLRDVVTRALGQAKHGVPVEVSREDGAGQRATGLAGSLERLPFAALLHHLHGLRATGVLHLASGRKRKWIQFREGYPVSVRSNLVNECLGNLLVRSGRVTPKQAAESRQRMREGRLQGEILVAMDVMSESELTAALRLQAEEKLFEIFEWESGSFRFDVGGRLQRANELRVERSPANLILEGVRTRLPLAHVDAWLGADRRSYVAPAESPFYRFQEIDLAPAEQAVLERLDGSQRLSALLGSDEGLRRTLYALLAAGLLELRSRAPNDGGAAPSRSTPEPRPRSAGVDEEKLRADLAAAAAAQRGRSHFEVLGVAEDADDAAVREAYERLAQLAHPDRVSACGEAVRELAEQVFARLVEAYETLSDPRRRQIYRLELRKAARRVEEQAQGRQALDAELEFQRGERALRQRSYEEALLHFGKALELYPHEGEYHAHYAWALYQCHPSDPAMVGEALEHAQRGVKLASEREKPYLFLGRLCKAVGRVDAAEKMFTRAVQIRPDCAEALSELRLINMRRSKEKGIIRRLLRR